MGFSELNICIVGLGLIGGSIAKGLKDLRPKNLWAIDKNTDILRTAEEENAIDKGFLQAEDILEKSDIVILSLYPEDTVKFIIGNMDSFKSGCIITDTCGLKSAIIRLISKKLRDDIEFIGGHPMAGREAAGFYNSDKAIFYNSNYFITPTAQNSKEALDIVGSLITALGCKNIIAISPEEHDSVIAYTSHLPHILAVSLINCLDTREELKGLIGGSFKDATRVADINSKLWIELLLLNKENLMTTIDCFLDNLIRLKEAISAEDAGYLENEFARASTKRRGIGQ
jgi:Prephenate dehydrogenase